MFAQFPDQKERSNLTDSGAILPLDNYMIFRNKRNFWRKEYVLIRRLTCAAWRIRQCLTKMGFGSDLKNSHEAVLKLQDWELRLLETVKKFMALRIKSDKEYASTLQNLCNQVDKESTIQMNYVSNVSKREESKQVVGRYSLQRKAIDDNYYLGQPCVQRSSRAGSTKESSVDMCNKTHGVYEDDGEEGTFSITDSAEYLVAIFSDITWKSYNSFKLLCGIKNILVLRFLNLKSWLLMIQQTEQLSKIMKTHAEDLNSGPLHRLTMMIKDKQQVKKSYIGVHQQIEAEMIKVTKTELEKLKSSYRQLIKEMNSAKEKYKEALAKGKETEKAKERYDKATMKLHMLHNQKSIFDEYSQITSLVTEEIVNVHKEIQMSVEQIDPSTEYNNFIDVHRSNTKKLMFINKHLIDCGDIASVMSHQINMNMLKTLAEELMQTQQMLLNKEEAVLELEKRIEESSKTYEKKSDIVLLLSQKQTLEELKQSVQQLRCTEAKFTAQKELLEQKVQENDGKEPPPVVNYEEDARSVTSMYNLIVKQIQMFPIGKKAACENVINMEINMNVLQKIIPQC
ncbi:hypothetical protein HPG69_017160 [Diceros bicornis minor]|uniref:F-BAR domain-containing protein n=1 Tax=Diceros bicornis minor TaxID=77932 RepID=A0A7J7ECK2_DICBM|nr:hypothetical protein HPG69_017160 [Diceros bicornis minor]